MDTWQRVEKARIEFLHALQAQIAELGTAQPDAPWTPNTSQPTTTARRVRGGRGITTRVLHYLGEHAGRPINATAIAQGIGAPTKVNSVQATLSRMVKEKRVRKLGAGRYQPIATPMNGHGHRAAA